MTADEFAEDRDQEKDMRAVADLLIDNITDLINDKKRPFGSSDPSCDILEVIGYKTEDSEEEGAHAYAIRLLDALPDYFRQKLKDAEPPDRGVSLLGP